jgi:hypothetical protein
MANRAGCPNALNTRAVSVILARNPSVFVIPILQYYNIKYSKKGVTNFFNVK